jgi:thioredoxin reductase
MDKLTRMLDLLQPGWNNEVTAVRFMPNIRVSHDSRQARHGGGGVSPGTSVQEIKGLYVAGDWVGSEGRLAETAMSRAKKAAQDILQHFR